MKGCGKAAANCAADAGKQERLAKGDRDAVDDRLRDTGAGGNAGRKGVGLLIFIMALDPHAEGGTGLADVGSAGSGRYVVEALCGQHLGQHGNHTVMDAQQNHGGVDAAVDDAGEHTAVLKQPVDADGQLFTQPVGQRADGDQGDGGGDQDSQCGHQNDLQRTGDDLVQEALDIGCHQNGKYHRQHRGGIVDHAEGNAEEAVAGHAVGN